MRFGLCLILLLGVLSVNASTPLIVAHRGASHDAPENTLAAFKLAWEQGADAVEGDFMLTADGEIVCFHDKTTKRLTDQDLEVSKTTLAELQNLDVGSWKDQAFEETKIPVLSEVLATLPEGKQIFVEIKCGPEIIQPLVAELNQSGVGADSVVVISFNAQVIREFKKIRPQHKAYWLCRIQLKEAKWTPSLESILGTLEDCGADGLDAHFSIPEAYSRALLKAGYEWHGWTVDQAGTAEKLAERGIHSITTNRPGMLRKALGW